MICRRLGYLAVSGSLLVLPAATGSAQTPAVPEEAKAAMAPLGWLIGQWSGEAAYQGPEGPKVLRQTEEVRVALEGALVVIEGTGLERQEGDLGPVVFRAFAVVSAAEEPGRHRVAAWQGGRFVDAVAQVAEDGTFTWGFGTPDGGEVRYVISRPEPDLWHEEGSFRAPGGDAWSPFVELTLRRDAGGASR
jgi:hypothetical protein